MPDDKEYEGYREETVVRRATVASSEGIPLLWFTPVRPRSPARPLSPYDRLLPATIPDLHVRLGLAVTTSGSGSVRHTLSPRPVSAVDDAQQLESDGNRGGGGADGIKEQEREREREREMRSE